tara:strand:+ start:957 stop:1199 length:243 start_codon:yes stop_codon:yes gene_type:complete
MFSKALTKFHAIALLLHRAFSVMIYNRSGQLLIQKRANTKYHSARLWANSCCGHPRRNETPKDAAIHSKEDHGSYFQESA